MEHFATTIALVGIVIIVSSLLSGVVERSGLPLVAVFLALGALLGPWGLGVVDVTLDSPTLQVVATLALVLVLFTDAVTLEMHEARAHRDLALVILGPGTLLVGALTALAAWYLLDLTVSAAAMLGAALASTDPVILRSLLRSRRLPTATRIALRLETGMNDVALLPVIVIAIMLVAAGDVALTARELARNLSGLFVLGPVLGAAVGWIGIAMLIRVRSRIGVRRDYESLYALGLAFTGYAAAEAVGGSGFLAAFTAGLMVAIQDVELCDCFLEYGESTAEMLMLLAFVALGASLIWTGLSVIDGRTLAFAAVALGVRTLVLWPMLAAIRIAPRDRRLIALLGPRGLSALLLVLLPVFAGVAGADRLFTVACLVVLLSVVIHGGGITLFLRGAGGAPGRIITGETAAVADARGSSAEAVAAVHAPEEAPPERMELSELQDLRDRGEPVVIVDARAERSYMVADVQAAGAVRVLPDDPVRSAQEQRLSQHATLVIYCA